VERKEGGLRDQNTDVGEPVPEGLVSARSVSGLITARLVIGPAICFLLFWALGAGRVPFIGLWKNGPSEPVLRLVVLVQACMPSAQFSLLALQQLGLRNAAEQLAVVFAYQYPIAIVTLVGWLSLAMAMVWHV